MTRVAIVATGSALLVAGLGFLLTSNNSTSTSGTSKELEDIDEDDDNVDYITPEEVTKVFDQLYLEMQQIYAMLAQQVQALQMQGANIGEKQLRGLVRSEMERSLLAKQQAVVDKFDMDYDCLEEATWEFLENEEEHPSVKRSVERFQKFWETVTGEELVGWRPGKEVSAKDAKPEDILSPQQLIPVAEKYFGALTECMRDIVTRFQAEGKNLKDPSVQQELNMEFANNVNDAGEAALEKEGTSLRQFEASIKAHSGDATVGQALGMLQMQQQRQLMAMGIA